MLSLNSDSVLLNCTFSLESTFLQFQSHCLSAQSQITVDWVFPPLFLAERKKEKKAVAEREKKNPKQFNKCQDSPMTKILGTTDSSFLTIPSDDFTFNSSKTNSPTRHQLSAAWFLMCWYLEKMDTEHGLQSCLCCSLSFPRQHRNIFYLATSSLTRAGSVTPLKPLLCWKRHWAPSWLNWWSCPLHSRSKTRLKPCCRRDRNNRMASQGVWLF